MAAIWAKVWPLLSAPPCKESEVDDLAVQQAFLTRRDDPAAEARAAELEAGWAAAARTRHAQAARLLGVA